LVPPVYDPHAGFATVACRYVFKVFLQEAVHRSGLAGELKRPDQMRFRILSCEA
jgi:hypothetical protein